MSLMLKNEFETQLSYEEKEAILASAKIAELFGVSIYLIGGIVRDLIMHNSIKDIDITVEGNAVEFAKFLETKCQCKIISTQENLKTAKVLFNNEIEIDFASTREEKYESSGRLPVAYNFGCPLKDDVRRRDFTINTLAVKLTGNDKYTLIDYYNGYDDIKNKKITILHNQSFIDDPSRIIRAIKFRKRFDFTFDDNTYNLMQEYLKNPDKNMPLERIKSELKQYFSINSNDLYDDIIATNAYKLVSNNIPQKVYSENLHKIKNYNLYKEQDIPFIYLCTLLVNSDILSERLNLTSTEKKILSEIKEIRSKSPFSTDEEIYKCFINKEKLSLAVYYFIYNDLTIIKFLEELSKIKLHITGQDLLNIGLKPSKQFAEIFDLVLKEKINGSINTKEEELNFVRSMINAKFFI